MNVNSCVCCGAIIPDGRMVCPVCENQDAGYKATYSKGMPIINVYETLQEFSDYVKGKLTEEDLNQFADCTFAPLKIWLNETDMSIEALIVPVKNMR